MTPDEYYALMILSDNYANGRISEQKAIEQMAALLCPDDNYLFEWQGKVHLFLRVQFIEVEQRFEETDEWVEDPPRTL